MGREPRSVRSSGELFLSRGSVIAARQYPELLCRLGGGDSAGREVIKAGMFDPVEQSWCHLIVQGRLPELIRDGKALIEARQAPFTPLEIGTHLSVPIVLPDGEPYGTLCTFAFHVDERGCRNRCRKVSEHRNINWRPPEALALAAWPVRYLEPPANTRATASTRACRIISPSFGPLAGSSWTLTAIELVATPRAAASPDKRRWRCG